MAKIKTVEMTNGKRKIRVNAADQKRYTGKGWKASGGERRGDKGDGKGE